MDYKEEAIKLLIAELNLPMVDGKVPDDVLNQFASTVGILTTILSNDPQLPITVFSSGFDMIIGGKTLPGMPPHSSQFNTLNSSVAEAWRNVGDTSPISDVVITEPARIIDANKKQVYP